MSEFHLTAESPQTEVILLKTFVNRACGFFSSTACFADFYGHHDTKTVTIKKNCDLNGNNCKVEITYFHLGCKSLPILCSSYSSTYLFLIHFVPTDHQEGGAAPPPLSPPQRGGPHRPILRRPLDAAVADTTPRLASLNAPYTFDRGVLEPIRVCSEPTFARRSGSERRLSSEQASYGTSPVTAASAVSATLPRNAPFRLDPSLRPTVYRMERNPSQQPSAWGPSSQGNWTGIGCPLASSGRRSRWHAVPRPTSRSRSRSGGQGGGTGTGISGRSGVPRNQAGTAKSVQLIEADIARWRFPWISEWQTSGRGSQCWQPVRRLTTRGSRPGSLQNSSSESPPYLLGSQVKACGPLCPGHLDNDRNFRLAADQMFNSLLASYQQFRA